MAVLDGRTGHCMFSPIFESIRDSFSKASKGLVVLLLPDKRNHAYFKFVI